jgi:hypothetical protein
VVYFDIVHSRGHAIIPGLNQGGRRIGGNSAVDPVGVYSVSLSVALLLARFGLLLRSEQSQSLCPKVSRLLMS